MIYKKNLLILSKFPELVDRLKQANTKLNLYKGNRGHLTAAYPLNSGKKMLLHSEFDPIEEARIMTGQSDFTRCTSIFVLGLGLGYHLQELIKIIPTYTIIYVLEPELEMYKAAMNSVDFSLLVETKRIRFLWGSIQAMKLQLNRLWSDITLMARLSNVGFYIFPPFQRMEPGFVKQASEMVIGLIKTNRKSLGIDVNIPILGLKNMLMNMQEVASSITVNGLKDKFKGMPAIIVSAGPSLEKNYHLLREAKGKFTILAVDAIFKKLLDAEIVPDAVVVLDRSPVIYERFFQDIEVIPNSVLLIAEAVADPRIVRRFPQRSIIPLSRDDLFQIELGTYLGTTGTIQTGLSVAHLAFTFAQLCGMEPLIFIGQDLAFGNDGHTHSPGTPYENDVIEYHSNPDIKYVDGYYGGVVPTREDFFIYREWFEIKIAESKGQFINATEGGADIKGTLKLPFHEVIKQFAGKRAELENCIVEKVDYEKNIEDIKVGFRNRVAKNKVHCVALSEAVENCQNIINYETTMNRALQRLNKIQKTIDEIFLDTWASSSFQAAIVTIFERFYKKVNEKEATVDEFRQRAELFLPFLQDFLAFLQTTNLLIDLWFKEVGEYS